MKRLWIAVLLLAAVFGTTQYSSHYLGRFTDHLAATLNQAEEYAELGDWPRAESVTRQAYEQWEQKNRYLHIMLRHADIDQIHAGFREVLEFLTCQESGEYSAANARLTTQIELLYEAEQLTLKNIL